jgi:hypothetical protein
LHSDCGRPTTIFHTTFAYLYSRFAIHGTTCGSGGGLEQPADSVSELLQMPFDLQIFKAQKKHFDKDPGTSLK